MKVLILSCLLIAIVVVQSERCRDKDPLTCTTPCGPNQVHACRDDRCYCMPGQSCLMNTDCSAHCTNDQHLHCIDGECHCLKMDEVDKND